MQYFSIVVDCSVSAGVVVPDGEIAVLNTSNPSFATVENDFMEQCRFGVKIDLASDNWNKSKESYEYRRTVTFKRLVAFALSCRPCDIVTLGLNKRVSILLLSLVCCFIVVLGLDR